jgi:hypothetical protein
MRRLFVVLVYEGTFFTTMVQKKYTVLRRDVLCAFQNDKYLSDKCEYILWTQKTSAQFWQHKPPLGLRASLSMKIKNKVRIIVRCNVSQQFSFCSKEGA